MTDYIIRLLTKQGLSVKAMKQTGIETDVCFSSGNDPSKRHRVVVLLLPLWTWFVIKNAFYPKPLNIDC